MLKCYFDLKYYKENAKKNNLLTDFIDSMPNEVKKVAIVDIYNFKSGFIDSLAFDESVTTYGSAYHNADIFICFEQFRYNEIASIVTNKHILSVNFAEDNVEDFFDLASLSWELIFSKYQEKKQGVGIKQLETIAFITPLNTDKSAIARYSVLTLRELCKRITVDVYSLEENAPNTFGARNVLPISVLPYLHNRYDEIISVLGNSSFHDKMTQYHLHFASNALVHDSHLLNYSYHLFGGKYISAISSFYNNKEITDDEVLHSLNNFSDITTTAIEPVLEASKTMFVHSKKTFDSYAEKGQPVSYLPFCIYNNVQDEKLNAEYKKQCKIKLGYKEDDILIVSLGSVAVSKLSDVILKAFIASTKENNVKLAFIGDATHFSDFLILAEKQENVKIFKEFVSDETYEDYLYAADIAIQLRNSSGGQISGALADNISAKLYTISCKDLTESIEAPSFLFGLQGIPTVETVKQKLEEVLQSKIYLSDFSAEKEKYIQKHNFANYTDLLLEALKNNL